MNPDDGVPPDLAAIRARFDAAGCLHVPAVLTADDCALLGELICTQSMSGGSRGLLAEPWCAALAQRLREHPGVGAMLGNDDVAVQCTYFEKSVSRNWLVPLHQDLGIPVAARVDGAGLSGWSLKEGALHVHAPVALLERMVAVRVHLDVCAEMDGPLRVVPGSHRFGLVGAGEGARLRRFSAETVCVGAPGDAWAMRPLLLHASSKARGTGRRRVLHFLFGPAHPGYGVQWRRVA